MSVALHHLNTPPDFLDLVRVLAPKNRIGLDPCSNASSTVDARVSYTEKQNGLLRSWRRFGLVFVNPPHSMSPYNIEPWMEKAWEEFIWEAPDKGDSFVGLVPAKPDTAWFHDHASLFPGKCFLRGRLKYWQNGKETPGPGKFGSLVLYAGPELELFHDVFGPLGWCP